MEKSTVSFGNNLTKLDLELFQIGRSKPVVGRLNKTVNLKI